MTHKRAVTFPVPVNLPVDGPSAPIPLGDAATDAAKMAAQDANANATSLKIDAIAQLNEDTDAYEEIVAHYNAVQASMTPADRSGCLAAIQQMAAAQATQSNQVAACTGYIYSGDVIFGQADLMPENPAPPKTMRFNDAKNSYNAGPPCIVTANNAHAQFVPAQTSANTYLANYP